MKIISVDFGLPSKLPYRGRGITPGIFKEPVQGRIKVHRLNLEGDRQANLSVHGGIEKAVYAYPSEHYEFWKGELHETDLPWGMFGENPATEGLLQDKVNIGDKFQIRSIIFRSHSCKCVVIGSESSLDETTSSSAFLGAVGQAFIFQY